MAHPAQSVQGFTRVELLVAIAVIVIILGFLARSAVISACDYAQLIVGLNNARQIQMATMAMAVDGKTNGNPSLGWPGDLKANGFIATPSDFVNLFVRNDYLKSGDLVVFAAPGCPSYPGGTLGSGSNPVLVPPFTEEYNAFKVFLVKNDDSDDTLFLTSKNYTYNTPLNDPIAPPYGDKGFIVLRKNGNSAILKKHQAQSLQLIGNLPGGGEVESAKNCLNPGNTSPQPR